MLLIQMCCVNIVYMELSYTKGKEEKKLFYAPTLLFNSTNVEAGVCVCVYSHSRLSICLCRKFSFEHLPRSCAIGVTITFMGISTPTADRKRTTSDHTGVIKCKSAKITGKIYKSFPMKYFFIIK